MGAHLRDVEWEAQVDRDQAPRPDPGAPAPHDPRVSKVIYALRYLDVAGQATAIDVLVAAGLAPGSPSPHVLTVAQFGAILTGIRAPGQPEEIVPGT